MSRFQTYEATVRVSCESPLVARLLFRTLAKFGFHLSSPIKELS